MLLGNAAALALSRQPAAAAATCPDPLGAPLSGGELPHLAACALHVLRAGVVEVGENSSSHKQYLVGFAGIPCFYYLH